MENHSPLRIKLRLNTQLSHIRLWTDYAVLALMLHACWILKHCRLDSVSGNASTTTITAIGYWPLAAYIIARRSFFSQDYAGSDLGICTQAVHGERQLEAIQAQHQIGGPTRRSKIPDSALSLSNRLDSCHATGNIRHRPLVMPHACTSSAVGRTEDFINVS